MRKAVVTGIGLITPLGNDRETSWEGLKAGRSGIDFLKDIDFFDLRVRIGGQVKDFPPEKGYENRDTYIQLAIAAAREALDDAGIDLSGEDADSIGCVISSSKGGLYTLLDQHREWLVNNKPISWLTMWNFMPNMASSAVSEVFDLRGPSSSMVAACATGAHSVIRAAWMIRSGECDVALAGSTDASIVPAMIGSFDQMRVLAREEENPPQASRPFDKNRKGFVIGEGCAVLVIETMERAKQRGSHIYGEITGTSWGSNAYHETRMSPDSKDISRLITLAIRQANLSSTDIDYLNAHGTGTPQNDVTETMAIKEAFGEYAPKLSISSIKSMIGHLLGAAGSAEIAALLLAMRDDFVPPTRNLTTPDPLCDLDYTPNHGREKEIQNALSLSFGFGGQIGVIVASKV